MTWRRRDLELLLQTVEHLVDGEVCHALHGGEFYELHVIQQLGHLGKLAEPCSIDGDENLPAVVLYGKEKILKGFCGSHLVFFFGLPYNFAGGLFDSYCSVFFGHISYKRAGIYIYLVLRMVMTCPVCEKLKEVCKDAGQESACAVLFEKLDKNELTTDQFVDGLLQIPAVKEKMGVTAPSA